MQQVVKKLGHRRPEPLWISILCGAILATAFYAIEAYELLLGSVYGVLLAELYNRSNYGKRIRTFLSGPEERE